MLVVYNVVYSSLIYNKKYFMTLILFYATILNWKVNKCSEVKVKYKYLTPVQYLSTSLHSPTSMYYCKTGSFK